MLTQKRRGRPATGKGFTIGVRVHPNQLAILDAWIAAQPEPQPSRPEAIRQILNTSLGGHDGGEGSTEADVVVSGSPANPPERPEQAQARIRQAEREHDEHRKLLGAMLRQ